jgi:hypothetical protein
MNKLPGKQKGASLIGTIIILAALGYGGYLGIQYVPQVIESKSIDSILDNMETAQRSDPVTSKQAATIKVTKLLQINGMNDMTDNFTVERHGDKFTITFSYDRELNLGYKIKPIHYEKSVTLN